MIIKSNCFMVLIEIFQLFSQYFPSPKFRSYDDALKNISLILVNDHFTEVAVRPNVPAAVDIRGIQIKTVPDQLPDVSKFIEYFDQIKF